MITLQKTWVKETRTKPLSLTSTKTSNYWLYWTIKELFLQGNDKTKGGPNAWTVVGSSDSVTAGMDTVDRWVTYSNVVSSAGAHSWIVLRQAAIGGGSGLELCIDVMDDTSYADELTIAWSYSAGFTGGSTTARPTATDEHVPFLMSPSVGGTGSAADTSVTKVMSSDGKCTRFFIARDRSPFCIWLLETLSNPRPFVDENFFLYMSETVPSRTSMSSNNAFYARLNGVEARSLLTLPCYTTSGSSASYVFTRSGMNSADISGRYPIFPTGMAVSTIPNIGRAGDLIDLYEVGALPPGLLFPTTGLSSGLFVWGEFAFGNDGNPLLV